MTQLTEQYYAVEVPSMAFGIMINNYGDESELMYMLSMVDIGDNDDDTEETLITKKLLPGNWKFLFTTKEMTGDRAAQIVERSSLFPLSFIDYEFTSIPDLITYDTAKDALKSLLRSKGLDDKKNYAILKKEP